MRPLLLCAALALGSCSSPPRPPTVDESQKRPANTAMAVELQSCRSELQNTRILANESSRAAEAASATAAKLASQQQALLGRAMPAHESRNTIYTVLLAFGSTRVVVPDFDAGRLLDEARAAPLIVLRGRTDGTAETSAESRIARERAEAVRTYLVQAGVEPARIRTTWQPIGDHAADNDVAGGRALNRRVEIEVYRVAPQFALSGRSPM